MLSCKICDVQYSSHGSLYTHIQSKHLELKPKCRKCNKQFVGNASLTRHTNNVHNKIKYGCSQCHKAYSSNTSLRRHVKSFHENLKYPCNLCDYQATEIGHLTRHKRSIHAGETYPCQICGKKFLKRRMLLHTSNQYMKELNTSAIFVIKTLPLSLVCTIMISQYMRVKHINVLVVTIHLQKKGN